MGTSEARVSICKRRRIDSPVLGCSAHVSPRSSPCRPRDPQLRPAHRLASLHKHPSPLCVKNIRFCRDEVYRTNHGALSGEVRLRRVRSQHWAPGTRARKLAAPTYLRIHV